MAGACRRCGVASGREEIRSLLESQMFGRAPGRHDGLSFDVVAIDKAALGGKAVRKEVAIRVEGRPLTCCYMFPPGAAARPVFVGLGFHPNHSVSADPGIRLAGEWAQDKATQADRTPAPPAPSSRGAAASRWQLEKLLSRGYGLATMYYGDIEPDIAGAMSLGIRARAPEAGRASARRR